MARWGLQIEKSVSFRGATQPFSNTYYYEWDVPNQPPTGTAQIASANALIDAVLPLERAAHATNVTFVMARVWSQIGSITANEMIVQRALSGAGTGGGPNTSLDKERAFLIRFRAGVDTRGRPVYLRKWFHLQVNAFGGDILNAGQLTQEQQLSAQMRTGLVNLGNSLKTVTPGAGPAANLVAKNGRGITGDTVAHPYLEHHQLGEAWRGS